MLVASVCAVLSQDPGVGIIDLQSIHTSEFYFCFYVSIIYNCEKKKSTIYNIEIKKQSTIRNDRVTVSPGIPDYGFYSPPGDQRAPLSYADYGSLGPRVAQMLRSEHPASASNSPLHHLPSPDQFKNPGLYRISFLWGSK